MLVVRPSQWEALRQEGLGRFATEMVERLSAFAPDLARATGAQRMRELVRLGIKRGQRHGFTHRGPLCFYLETMVVLGSYFDTDPTLKQATQALHVQFQTQEQKASVLYDAVREYCERVLGAQNQNASSARECIRSVSYDALPAGDLTTRALNLFDRVFPAKYAFAGEASLRMLIRQAESDCAKIAVRSDAGKLLLALLLFVLGRGVASDPAYPWVAEALGDPTLDPEARMRALNVKARSLIPAAHEA